MAGVGALAARYHPQLATLVKKAPEGDDWLHELKYDGYRIGAAIERDAITLMSRRDNDWTAQFPEIVAAVKALRLTDTLLDGEVCAVLPDGRTSFHALQYFRTHKAHLVYFVFDVLWLRGTDVRSRPLEERKSLLQEAIGTKHERVVYADHVLGNGPTVLAHACKVKAEGIVSKLRGSRYEDGARSKSWVKTKCVQRQEFVIAGFTDPTDPGDREIIGALLVGVFDSGGRFDFAGKVGTGWNRREGASLRNRLERLSAPIMPFNGDLPDRALQRRSHWVRPELVCEIAFTEWPRDGHIRHPSFQGLHEDKRAGDVHRDVARSDDA